MERGGGHRRGVALLVVGCVCVCMCVGRERCVCMCGVEETVGSSWWKGRDLFERLVLEFLNLASSFGHGRPSNERG